MTRQRQSYAQFLAIVAPCAAKPRSIALEPHCVRAVASTEAANREQPDRGNFILQHKIALCAGLVAALAVAGHALAQPAPPPVYPGTVYPGTGLPPHEIVTIVRSTGLEPMGSPVRQGPTYALRAVDPAGEEVRVDRRCAARTHRQGDTADGAALRHAAVAAALWPSAAADGDGAGGLRPEPACPNAAAGH